jgi:Ni/Fe-hydrogenase 1 B-type cytochrome subunit
MKSPFKMYEPIRESILWCRRHYRGLVRAPVTRQEHPLQVVLLHWAHVVALLVLVVTGFYLHRPYYSGGMAANWFLHITFMWVLLFGTAARVYWAFFGSGSAALGSRRVIADYHWFAPSDSRAVRHRTWETLKYYLLLRCTHPTVVKFNPLQKLSYVAWLVAIVPAALSGFTIRPVSHPFFRWLAYAVGGLEAMRFIHYLLMWFFIVTVAVHIYLAFVEGIREIPLMFWWRESVPEEK